MDEEQELNFEQQFIQEYLRDNTSDDLEKEFREEWLKQAKILIEKIDQLSELARSTAELADHLGVGFGFALNDERNSLLFHFPEQKQFNERSAKLLKELKETENRRYLQRTNDHSFGWQMSYIC